MEYNTGNVGFNKLTLVQNTCVTNTVGVCKYECAVDKGNKQVMPRMESTLQDKQNAEAAVVVAVAVAVVVVVVVGVSLET